jgi:hypothetical protein
MARTHKTARYHEPGFVYAMLRHGDRAIKIGLSGNPQKRLIDVMSYKANGRVSVLAQVRVSCMACSEAELHDLLQEFRLPPTQFTGTEWFRISEDTAKDALLVMETMEQI